MKRGTALKEIAQYSRYVEGNGKMSRLLLETGEGEQYRMKWREEELITLRMFEIVSESFYICIKLSIIYT